ncbi:MAG TPA: hypothetical protein VK436_13555 [Methanocella sp.]|nr:hypothetical protein [Methanocella sp.]
MLHEDWQGDFLGKFFFKGRGYEYRVRGYGKPVLITTSISSDYGSYEWRFIFECLAGTFQVYAADILGPDCQWRNLPHSPAYYEGFVRTFLETVIGKRSSIISGPVDAPFALKASLEIPKLVDKVLIVSHDGVWRINIHDRVCRSVLRRILRMPNMENVTRSNASKRIRVVFPGKMGKFSAKEPRPMYERRVNPKYPPLPLLSERWFVELACGTSLMQASTRPSKNIRKSRHIRGEIGKFHIPRNTRLTCFRRSGELPVRKGALQFCDDAIRFLG